jgi:hypothetical protein
MQVDEPSQDLYICSLEESDVEREEPGEEQQSGRDRRAERGNPRDSL